MKKVEMKPGQKYYYIVLLHMIWESKMNVKEGTVPPDTDNFFLTKEDAENARAQIEEVFKKASLEVAKMLEED